MYHFLKSDRRLQFEPYTPVVVGETLVYPGEPELCMTGLHASKRIIDALKYAPGPILCIVELGGEIIHGKDKAVAQERTVSWMQDISPTLHEFACQVAEEALKKYRVTDKRSWKAIEVKRLWLKGEASDEELEASRSAAYAAWDAARSAAYAANAWSAADAAGSAADVAYATDAARSAAYAAGSATDAAYAAGSAAWSAAWSAAARDAAAAAARSAQNEKLEAMIKDL